MTAALPLDEATIGLYVRHAFAGMEGVLDRLDDETVNERPAGPGTNSVAVLVAHCCGVARYWFEAPGLGRESPRDRDAEFVTTATVAELRARIADVVDRMSVLVPALVAGPTASDHPYREMLPPGDHSDGAIVLHVLEELFQHLGHMEVTADALGR